MQQVALDLLLADLGGRSAVELGQLDHRLQVRVAGPIGQPAKDHVRFHLLAQWAHDCLLCHGRETFPGKSVTQASSTIAATTQQRRRSLPTTWESHQTKR